MADDLILDLTDYKDTVGSYVAPGRYPVVVEDAELGESSQKKTPQLTLWLRVVGGEEDGKTLVEQLYLTDASRFRTVGFLQALGIPTPKKKLTFRLQSFVGRRLFVVVEDDTYGNRTRSRVTQFERFTGGGSAAEADLDALEEESATVAPEMPTADPEAAPTVTHRDAAPMSGPEPESPAVTAARAAAAAAVIDEEDEAIDLDELDL